jgi:signal transduction histidine kinase
MEEYKELKIRPYARLLTMLGEQLIKNERIALIELIKNAYDADSPWVKISFIGFDDSFHFDSESKIIIEDGGSGMNAEIIEKHWLNPATPEKLQRKARKNTTPSGRIIQGEKGIGRFAMLKLGRKIKVITRANDENSEHVIDYDFSIYDDEFTLEEGKAKILFIDDLSVSLQTRDPEIIKECSFPFGARKIKRPPHGTRIEISDIKGSWSDKKVEDVYRDIARFESIFSYNIQKNFEVQIYKDDELYPYKEQYLEQLKVLLEDHSVIRIEKGIYDAKKNEFRFVLNDKPQTLELRDPNLMGLTVFRKSFGKGGEDLDERDIECGTFQFGFYVFDFSTNAPLKFKLDKEDKDIIRPHRIYLYRDGIRVYPYGEPDDDWLRIDAYRGTVAAGDFLSNDQVVGYVDISQKENPKLKDKTNREGLIEEGNAATDFIALLKIFLAYIRQKTYASYRRDIKYKNVQDVFRNEQVKKEFDDLRDVVKDNKQALALVSKAEKAYSLERRYLVTRAETTEDLAGVGLSVETASHDIMAIMSKAMLAIDNLIRESLHNDLDQNELHKELQSIRGMLSFIESQLKDIQLLFKSSKRRRRNIKVKEILEKVDRIYHNLLKKEGIELAIHVIGSPLVAKTTDAVLLQLFINLFDNSVYWLQQSSVHKKKIEILLDGDKGEMIFSDNGPGVDKEDAPYIFEPFYSGKGEEGRGLGLYIARQLLERNDYTIELVVSKSEKILSGANFVVNFVAEDK